MVGVHRDVEGAALCRMDAGQATGAGIARDIPALALGPHKAASLDRQGAAQQREAEILSNTAMLTLKQRRGDTIGEQCGGEIVEYRTKHQLRFVRPAAL